MVRSHYKLILWTGQRHSGKTTMAATLAQVARHEGFDVGGLLAFSVYRDGRLVGFDGFDLRSGARAALLRCGPDTSRPGAAQFSIFNFQFSIVAEGLKLGIAALNPLATESADLIIVDEFGPFELDYRGWRRSVDALLTSSDAVILLVVRQELAERVQCLYANTASCVLAAAHPQSINTVITILRDRSAIRRVAK